MFNEQELYDNECQFEFNNYLMSRFNNNFTAVLDIYTGLEMIRAKIKSEIERGAKALENAFTNC
jgi:hypothetical protein